MSFWSDLSGVVKGAIVVGAIGVVIGLMALTGIGPFGPEEEVTQQRGLPAATE